MVLAAGIGLRTGEVCFSLRVEERKIGRQKGEGF